VEKKLGQEGGRVPPSWVLRERRGKGILGYPHIVGTRRKDRGGREIGKKSEPALKCLNLGYQEAREKNQLGGKIYPVRGGSGPGEEIVSKKEKSFWNQKGTTGTHDDF